MKTRKLITITFGLLSVVLAGCNKQTSTSENSSIPTPQQEKYYYLTDVVYSDGNTLHRSISEDLKTVSICYFNDDVTTFYLNDDYLLAEETHQVEILEINEKTIYEYNENNQLVKKTEYDNNDIDEITSYQYEGENLVEITNFDSSYGLDQFRRKYVYQYEENLFREIRYVNNLETGAFIEEVIEHRTTVADNGTYTINAFYQNYGEGDFIQYYSEVYQDGTDLLLSYFDWESSFYEKYEYNENGYRAFAQYGYVVDSIEEPTNEMTASYDENGYLSAVNYTSYDDGVTISQSKKEVACDENGVVTKETFYDKVEDRWEEAQSVEYTFIESDIYVPAFFNDINLVAFYQGHYEYNF